MSVARRMQQAAAGSAGAGPEPSNWTDPDIANASYDSVSFSVSGQEANPFGVFFKSDGTAVYVIGTTGDDVNQYLLGTAWDISTASFVQSFSVSSQEIAPTSVFFRPDGTKMYVTGQGSGAVNEYSLSTAWDVSTASYVQNFSISGQESAVFGLFFKPDGTKMYVAGTSGDDVNEYNLSTAWDVSTASFLQASSVLSEVVSIAGLFFSPNGDYLYVTDNNSDDVNEYALSTSWDVSTTSYIQNFSVSGQVASPRELFFKSDGSKMYVLDGTTDTIYQYSTVTPSEWTDPDLANASYDAVSFSVSGQDSTPLGLNFNSDGTKAYIVGVSTDSIYEYTLGTAWDLSTASYNSVSFSLASQDTTPQSVAFNSDGTKMYVVGSDTDIIYQYSLSTGFDISTASYDSVSFDISSQATSPLDFCFSSDGTKLHVLDFNSDAVYQYSLSTGFDISSASYDSVSFGVTSQENSPTALRFNPDGNKMYVFGFNNDTVYQYSLSSAWDVSSATYDSVSFSVSSQVSNPRGLSFKSDGSKMFVVGASADTIYQYSTA